MGNRGNKLVFQLFRSPKLYRHVIDVVAQLSDFIVIGFLNPGVEISLGNALGGCADLPDRRDNGLHEIQVGKHNERDNENTSKSQKPDNQQHLPVGFFHGYHIAQSAHDPVIVAENDLGDGHGLFAGIEMAHPYPHPVFILQSSRIIRHILSVIRRKSGGGDEYLTVLIHGHDFHFIFGCEIFDVGSGAGIKILGCLLRVSGGKQADNLFASAFQLG